MNEVTQFQKTNVSYFLLLEVPSSNLLKSIVYSKYRKQESKAGQLTGWGAGEQWREEQPGASNLIRKMERVTP